jgi:hypothetical protein
MTYAEVTMLRLALLLLISGCGLPSEEESAPQEEAEQIEMTEECADYLDCMAVILPSSMGGLLESYGSEGECWVSESNKTYCEEACLLGLEEMLELYPMEESCGGGVANMFDLDVVHVTTISQIDTHLVVRNDYSASIKELVVFDENDYYEIDILAAAGLNKLKKDEAIHVIGLDKTWLNVFAKAADGYYSVDSTGKLTSEPVLWSFE